MIPTIVLIACCKQKAPAPCRVRDMYCSQLFRKSVAWAESHGYPWAVLSAKHFLLLPDDVIHPYDVTLSKMSLHNRKVWSRTMREIISRGFRNTRIIVLGGKLYRDAASLRDHEAPLAGLGIGQQLKWLTENTAKPAAVAA